MTDNNDYSFMKSGHDNLVQPDTTEENIEYFSTESICKKAKSWGWKGTV